MKYSNSQVDCGHISSSSSKGMKMKIIAMAVAVLVGSASVSQAAIITWTSSVYNSQGSIESVMGIDQFDQSGKLIYAVNVGGAAATLDQTVDIPFVASHPDLDLRVYPNTSIVNCACFQAVSRYLNLGCGVRLSCLSITRAWLIWIIAALESGLRS